MLGARRSGMLGARDIYFVFIFLRFAAAAEALRSLVVWKLGSKIDSQRLQNPAQRLKNSSLEASWEPLGASWEPLGASWPRLLRCKRPLGRLFGLPGGILEPLGAILGALGGVLGASWEYFGAILGGFWSSKRTWEASWKRLA